LEVQGGQDYFRFVEGTYIIACVLSSFVLYIYPFLLSLDWLYTGTFKLLFLRNHHIRLRAMSQSILLSSSDPLFSIEHYPDSETCLHNANINGRTYSNPKNSTTILQFLTISNIYQFLTISSNFYHISINSTLIKI